MSFRLAAAARTRRQPVLRIVRAHEHPDAVAFADDDSKEARAERSLAQIEAVLEARRIRRSGWQLVAIIGIPLLVAALLVRQARVSLV
jgi:hypothetical protein